ncbi:uncharacterized protein MJAP1_003800 [Malassezia japonica]|uniref:Thiamine-binding protein domain-containing protein n=1 Tax=Malassezia japonica TaxID=223818 RepID=A0AAF0F6R3_9BASI|nr:uncharacterized protein MJAP1_003800 [Malassezia japonica]WFD40811.1 hypothetical protein MJAP1_003800 [Malassezia japonica]
MTTPEMYAVADFCLIPMGTPTTSVGEYITECQRVLDGMAEQGIRYEVRFSSNPDAALQKCHEAVHALGVERIATDIRLGTRTDKPSGSQDTAHWAQGLTENQRKRESVLRRLDAKDA